MRFMKNRVLWLSALFILISASAWAEQDFYGIQIKSEEWAKALVLNSGNPDPNDLLDGPVLSHAVHAEASLKEVAERHINFRLTVFNDSEQPIAVEYHLRDFLVYTRDGKKYSLIDTEEDLPTMIDPRSKASFAPSFGNLSLNNSDVQMIVCSFDLGRTKVILFPWSMKDKVSKLVSPEPPPAPVKEEKRSAPEKGPRVKTPKRNFWDWFSPGNKNRVTPEELKRAPVMPTAVEAPVSDTQKKLDQAIEGFKYAPAGNVATKSAPPAALPGVAIRSEARVLEFNRPYNFVTLNLGERDGLQNGMTLSIIREGKLVAKAKVKQVRPAVSAAALLPGTIRSEVRAGDAVSFA